MQLTKPRQLQKALKRTWWWNDGIFSNCEAPVPYLKVSSVHGDDSDCLGDNRTRRILRVSLYDCLVNRMETWNAVTPRGDNKVVLHFSKIFNLQSFFFRRVHYHFFHYQPVLFRNEIFIYPEVKITSRSTSNIMVRQALNTRKLIYLFSNHRNIYTFVSKISIKPLEYFEII